MNDDEIGNSRFDLEKHEKHLENCLALLRARFKRIRNDTFYVIEGCEGYFESFGTGAIHHPNLDAWSSKEELKKLLDQYDSTYKELKSVRYDIKQVKK